MGPRVQISPQRIRVPDLAVLQGWPQSDVIVDPPLLTIEILSPGDTDSDTRARVQEYLGIGTKTVWLIDPWARTGHECDRRGWRERDRLEVDDEPIYVELESSFE